MKDIFTGIFSKVFGFFSKAEKENESAKEVAVNRLRVVLMQDRTNLTPELLEKMRGELIELLSKYVEMDKEALELNFEQEGDQMALMLSIPVLRAKDEDEIEEAEESEEDAEAEDNDETITSEEDDDAEETEEVSEENSNTK
ncbi:cell division topological specificity factor MinE [bacterium]|nr:cell division topological specificity factor MinE [bacterium]